MWFQTTSPLSLFLPSFSPIPSSLSFYLPGEKLRRRPSLALSPSPSCSLISPIVFLSHILLYSRLSLFAAAKHNPCERWLVGVHAPEEMSQKVPKQLGPTQLNGKRRHWSWWTVRAGAATTPSSATPTTGSQSQQVHLNLLFKMEPSVFDKSAQIVGKHFREKIKTLQVDPSQMGLILR